METSGKIKHVFQTFASPAFDSRLWSKGPWVVLVTAIVSRLFECLSWG